MRCKFLENHVYIGTTGQYRMCCVSYESDNVENVFTHTVEEWLNSETIKKAKQQLENNIWPDACIVCKSEEERGVQSKRLTKAMMGPGITHLDIRLGNSCNLKCISCNPRSSSSISQEVIEMKNNNIIPIHNDSYIVNNWYDENLIDELTKHNLKEVYFTGGEPLMVKNLDKFLEKLNYNVHVRINTNATIANPKILKLLKKFNNVTISLSIDAVGEKNDYIRYGSNWKEICENIKKYQEVAKVDITATVSVLNALYIDELKRWADKHSINVCVNFLTFPEYLHVKHAPKILKEKFNLDTWKDYPEDLNQQKLFKENIEKLDKFRNIKIKDYLPEVAQSYGIN